MLDNLKLNYRIDVRQPQSWCACTTQHVHPAASHDRPRTQLSSTRQVRAPPTRRAPWRELCFVLFCRKGTAELSPADFVIHVRDRGVVGSPQVLGLPVWDGDVGLAKVGVSKSIGGAVREMSQLCPVAPSPMGHVFGNIGVAEEKKFTPPRSFLPLQ